MTRRAGLLLAVLVTLVGGIGYGAYRVGILGDPCERLRERCANVSVLDLDVAMKCATVGLMTFGQRMPGPTCAKVLALVEDKGQ